MINVLPLKIWHLPLGLLGLFFFGVWLGSAQEGWKMLNMSILSPQFLIRIAHAQCEFPADAVLVWRQGHIAASHQRHRTFHYPQESCFRCEPQFISMWNGWAVQGDWLLFTVRKFMACTIVAS
jgi:hypothetical protein